MNNHLRKSELKTLSLKDKGEVLLRTPTSFMDKDLYGNPKIHSFLRWKLWLLM